MANKPRKRLVHGQPRYDVKYRDPDGRQRQKTFHLLRDANAFATTVEADKLRGAYIDPDAGRITFKAYAEKWLTDKAFRNPSTRAQVELRLRLHAYPVLGPKQLAQIKPSTIRAWLSGLSGAESTRRVIFANVSTVFAAAVDDEVLAKNPCVAGSLSQDRPKVQSRKVVPWEAERVGAVRDGLPETYRIGLDLGVGLGLRQGEVFGLSPDDVDFLRGKVTVRRQVKTVHGRLVFALPKGEKTREVPLPGALRDLLAAYLAARPARAVTLPWADLGGEPTTVALVLTSRESKALNKNYWNTYLWKPALTRAQVPTTRDNGMHALRHHYASVLLDAGENIKAISEYLGHRDPGFTLRTYTHLMPSSDERTRRAVDEAFGRYISGTSEPTTEAENGA